MRRKGADHDIKLVTRKRFPSLESSCVFFCGSEATGKTTCTGYVANRFKLAHLTETARTELDVRRTNFNELRSNGAAVNSFQRAVFERQIELELGSKPPYVSDGTCLENLAYASENARIVADLIEKFSMEPYAGILKRLQAGIVFLMRPHPSMMGQDGIRAGIDYATKQRIDAKLELLLQICRVKYIPVDSPNSAIRESLIDYILESKGFKAV